MNWQTNLPQNESHQTRLMESMPKPRNSEEDKAESLLNVLRGYEELTVDVRGIILSSNLEVVCITGYEEWEVIGKHISMFYTEEDIVAGKPESDLKSAELQGSIREEGWKVKKRNGKFWAKLKVFALRDSLKNLTGFRVIIRDETHKAFHDYKLNQRKRAQVEFYNYSTIGLIEFNLASGRITIINTFAQNLLGIARDAVFFSEIFADGAKYDHLINLIDRDRHTNNFEFQLKNGRWVSLDCKFFLKNGVVEALLTEITERKRREQEVVSLSEELQMFLYHASHDLRSPLTSIFGLLNLIELEGVSGENQYTAMIKSRVDHLDSLLRELTAVAVNNARPVDAQPFNVLSELHYAMSGIGVESVQLILDIDPQLEINTDLLRFRVIMKNLLVNATKFRDDTKPKPFVKVAITTSEWNEVVILVQDNGVGIREDQIDNVFKPFFRGHHSLSGHGLGLYIVRAMVRMLDGSVTISSRLREGTSVELRLKKEYL